MFLSSRAPRARALTAATTIAVVPGLALANPTPKVVATLPVSAGTVYTISIGRYGMNGNDTAPEAGERRAGELRRRQRRRRR